jgi:hypothetical protein
MGILKRQRAHAPVAELRLHLQNDAAVTIGDFQGIVDLRQGAVDLDIDDRSTNGDDACDPVGDLGFCQWGLHSRYVSRLPRQ